MCLRQPSPIVGSARTHKHTRIWKNTRDSHHNASHFSSSLHPISSDLHVSSWPAKGLTDYDSNADEWVRNAKLLLYISSEGTRLKMQVCLHEHGSSNKRNKKKMSTFNGNVVMFWLFFLSINSNHWLRPVLLLWADWDSQICYSSNFRF